MLAIGFFSGCPALLPELASATSDFDMELVLVGSLSVFSGLSYLSPGAFGLVIIPEGRLSLFNGAYWTLVSSCLIGIYFS